ncbi:hypothetical protein BRARA_B01840, partial [Brassica rapa]
HHFIWRALNNALPVGALLSTRGINSEVSCKRCGELTSDAETLRDWLSTNVSIGFLPPTGVTASPLTTWLLWNLWTARNKLIFENQCFQVADVISKAVTDAKEWEGANAKASKKKGSIAPVSKRLPSAPSCWIDGAWQEASKSGGMGWIIKTVAGDVLCRGSSNRSHVCTVLMAEALALREALKKAQELNLQSLQVFSDSQVLVSTLDAGVDLNEIAGVLQDVKNLATLFCPLSFVFISRVEKSQADTLAKSSLSRLLNVG